VRKAAAPRDAAHGERDAARAPHVAARAHIPWFLQVPLVTLDYALCGALVGASLVPPAFLVLWALRKFLLEGLLSRVHPAAGGVVLFCLFAGLSLFLFYFCGLLLTGLAVRGLSLGVRPGRHRIYSWTMVFWTVLNSIHTLAFRLILPIVPAGYFTSMYFRLAGCRMGKDVWLTTPALLDPYLISIGDGTVVGGEVTLSAHLFSNGKIYLAPIRIGRDCQIGAHALICAGVTVGDGATIGIHAYIRRGRSIPAGAHIEAMGGLTAQAAFAPEREADSSGGSFSLPGQPPRRARDAAPPRGGSRRDRSSG
jgi:acetyltransferase-like isoleucine patch superfamily enzyme